jgi:hypothetical protein
MANIIAGRFEQQETAQAAIDALMQAGFPREAISSFFVNPAGQHDQFAVGGDQDKSPGAKDTDKGIAGGMATGGAVGAAIGAATAPLTGPLGAITGGFVGAHIGSLMGTMKTLEPDGQGADENPVPVRSAGMLVAVDIDAGSGEGQVIETLRRAGGTEIERAHGTIVAGDWQDFNPVAPPSLVDGGQP